MTRTVKVNVQDAIVLVYSAVDKDTPPVSVHEQLLSSISGEFAELIAKEEPSNKISGIQNATQLSIEAPLDHRACVFVARCAYGQQQMWDLDDDETPENDLKSLVDLYILLCDKIACYATELVDACVESMQRILSKYRDVLHNPLAVLRPVFHVTYTSDGSETARTKIIKQLVHGTCAKDGSMGEWLKTYRDSPQHTQQGLGENFLVDLCTEFAGKVVRKQRALRSRWERGRESQRLRRHKRYNRFRGER